MALYVKTNTSAINSQRRLNTATKSLDTTYQRLSSGLRINSAKDDAAGLQISDRLTSQINGLGQGNRNANDGIALCQTMEGALDETTSMLQRIRTLAIQAANGTNTTNDRQAIQEEVAQLSAEITRIACKTTFAGRQCIAGVGGADKGGVLDSKGKVSFQVGAYAFDTLGISLSNGFTMSGLSSYTGNDGKGSVVRDGDSLRFSLSTAENAQEVLGYIDEYIKAVSSYKGTLGGVQNRFESAIRLNDTMRENLSDARSRIQDTDYAEEAANLAELMVRQQVCASIMKQINNSKSIILSLLGG